LIRDLAAAERSANKVRLLLRAEQLRDAAEVVPVLIVWGPGAPELAQGHELREGVHVVDGAHPERWRDLFNVPRLSPGMRRELHLRFEQFVLDRSTYDARVLPSLRAAVRACCPRTSLRFLLLRWWGCHPPPRLQREPPRCGAWRAST
jgi:hypothetical protein